jgi:hypothetical protein
MAKVPHRASGEDSICENFSPDLQDVGAHYVHDGLALHLTLRKNVKQSGQCLFVARSLRHRGCTCRALGSRTKLQSIQHECCLGVTVCMLENTLSTHVHASTLRWTLFPDPLLDCMITSAMIAFCSLKCSASSCPAECRVVLSSQGAGSGSSGRMPIGASRCII